MKRTRLLSLALIVAVLLMGAGYALWSEALRIDGTVCAGELDFQFEANFVGGTCYVKDDDAYTEDSGHTMVLKLDNMSPGATRTFDWCIENTGTIGLIIKDVVFTGNASALSQVLVGTETVEDYFNNLLTGKVIEPDDEKECFSTVFTINVDATEENFPEKECFDFTVTALVTQSCPEEGGGSEPEPEPECPTGLKFVGDKTSSGCKCYVDGELFYVFANGTEKSAGIIKEEIGCKDDTITVKRTYSDDCDELLIEFKTSKHQGKLSNDGIK